MELNSKRPFRFWRSWHQSNEFHQRSDRFFAALTQDALWLVTNRLYRRANSARILSKVMLIIACVVGIGGIFLFFGQSFGLEIVSNYELKKRDELTRVAKLRLEDIEEKRTELDLSRKGLRDAIVKKISKDFVRIYFDKRVDVSLRPSYLASDGSAIVIGDGGTILTRATSTSKWILRKWEGRTGKESLRGLSVSKTGSAILVGNHGQLLTRRDALANWIPHQWKDRRGRETMWNIFTANDESAIVIGSTGLLLTRAKGVSKWTRHNWDGRSGREVMFGLAANEDGLAVVTGSSSTLLVRTNATSNWARQKWDGRTGSEFMRGVSLAKDGSAIAAGNAGTLLIRSKGVSNWVQQDWDDRTGKDNFWAVSLTTNGSAIAIGANGLLLTRADASSKWVRQDWQGRRGRERLSRIYLAEDGSVIVRGELGTLLTRKNTGSKWVLQNWEGRRGHEFMYSVSYAKDGSTIALGGQGTLLSRGNTKSEWVRQQWLGRSGTENLWGVSTANSGAAIVTGDGGVLLERNPARAMLIAKAKTLENLRVAVTALPNYGEKLNWLNQIWELEVEAINLRIDKVRAEESIKTAQFGRRSREAELNLMKRFLKDCRLWPDIHIGKADPKALQPQAVLTRCISAYKEAIFTETNNNRYHDVADRITSGLLFILLFAAICTGYRYSLRLASFYDSRVDALILWAQYSQPGPKSEEKETDAGASGNPDMPHFSEIIKVLAPKHLGFK